MLNPPVSLGGRSWRRLGRDKERVEEGLDVLPGEPNSPAEAVVGEPAGAGLGEDPARLQLEPVGDVLGGQELRQLGLGLGAHKCHRPSGIPQMASRQHG